MKRTIKKRLAGLLFGKQAQRAYYFLQKLPENTLARLAPNRHYEQRKKRWQKRWADNNFNPKWKVKNIPKELQHAVESDWFSEGDSLLDIGCGDGDIARWLADQNFVVLGIDYSSSAIERATAAHQESSTNLSFQSVDVTQMPSPDKRFDALFDRGCFHIIPESYAAAYKEGIFSWSNPGANFLLLCTIDKGPSGTKQSLEKKRDWWMNHIRQTFEDTFSIEKIDNTDFVFSSEVGAKNTLPAIAVWMTRR